MKTLKTQRFNGTFETPGLTSSTCVKFIKDHNIQREDIQQICHDDYNVYLYYWAEEE
jgi:hypothetical protein